VFSIYQKTEGEIHDIEFDLYPIREDVFKFSYINSNANEAMAGIEKLLDAGKQVIINTNTRRTPFNIEFGGFDWPYDEKDGQSHNFLALAHDKENLYYVEMPELINEKNYIPYKGNKYVGMVRKADLIPAFELYVNYGTIDIDKNNLLKKSNLKECIGLSLENNSRHVFYKDGLKVTSGLAAIDLLIEMCDAGCLDLNSKGNKYLTGLHNFLRWKFHVIGARRKLLSYAFADYAEDCDSSIRNRLVKILDDAYLEWFKCKELAVGKYMVEKDYIVGKEFKELFISLRRLEEEIIRNLNKLWR
ncbi:MAG TPA: hypothetical protein VHT34_06100, partial [Clostridia bacterium]|nr:hypothetical protein [Clostridia bacterium]